MKKFLKAALLAVVVAAGGYGAYEAQCEEIQLSETMLANVEALADNESSTDWKCKGILGWCSAKCEKCGISISGLGNTIVGTHTCNY
ncbi:MAG: hypothetical protein E7099_09220 [Mediterranea massiliensis]|nr:hypothetical protein [Mediterranea massiliensis]